MDSCYCDWRAQSEIRVGGVKNAGVEECGRLCETFPYKSSCFLPHNLLMRFNAFERLQDLCDFMRFDPNEISLGDFMLFTFFMRFHAY